MGLGRRTASDLRDRTRAHRDLVEHAARRILVLDGAMGSRVRQLGLGEDAYRGERLGAHPLALAGNVDVLTLSQPALVRRLHAEYLEAGADIIQTNTFGASAIDQAAYGLGSAAFDMNVEAARIARAIADEYSARNPERPRFVAGSIGPTIVNLGRSGADRALYERVRAALCEQVRGLVAGGVDLLVVETIVDVGTAGACLEAIDVVSRERGSSLPLIISASVLDDGGAVATGQSAADFWDFASEARPLAVGINCVWGEKRVKHVVAELAALAPVLVSCEPSAGLPNARGVYEQTPDSMARFVAGLASEGLVNIAGGCCGTAPEHVAAIADAVSRMPPRSVPSPFDAPATPGL